MTNSSSTYLVIVVGAAIGAVITWWVYNRQKGYLKQDLVLQRVNELEKKNTHVLIYLETFAKHDDELLNKIVC
jgi:hypothetical protein